MKFDSTLVPGRLLRRYKRFLADVSLDSGEAVVAHCPNTGSMLGCAEAGSRVWLSPATNPARKLAWTWEIVEVSGRVRVGINTARSNGLVAEAIESGVVTELGGYSSIRREVRYGEENSRIDLLLARDGDAPQCYVEVKNVTLVEAQTALFPDAVTTRGTRHLRELARMVADGSRAVVFFCVQRRDARDVRPADGIDPAYGAALREAVLNGVEALAYRAEVRATGIRLVKRLPVDLNR